MGDVAWFLLIRKLIRYFVHKILAFILFFVDVLYDAIKSIAYFNVMDSDKANGYYMMFMSAFIALFIIFKIAKRYFITLIDEQEAQNLKASNLILKLAAIGFLIVLLPFLLKSFGNLVSELVKNINVIFNITSDKFSSILISNSGDSSIATNDFFTLDINKMQNGEFIYLPNANHFLCFFVVTLFSGYCMFLIGIQLGQRILSMVMKLIIAPYSLSSLVDKNSDSFSTWWRLFVADFLANYFQMLLLVIGPTILMGFNFGIEDTFTAGLAKDIALIGALFGVLNAPNGVSQLLGADIGVTNAMQSLQTTMTASNILGGAARTLGGVATYAGAKATYLTGRMLGGASMKQVQANSTPGTSSIIGGISGGFSGVGSGGGAASSSDSSIPSGANPAGSGVDLTMKQTPGQQGSFVSNRTGLSGLASAITSGGQLGDKLSGIKASGVMPNPVGSIANTIKSNGSTKDMLNQHNWGGLALRGAAWGTNKLYGASMNRLQRGVIPQPKQKKQPQQFDTSLNTFFNVQNNSINNSSSGGNFR